MRMMTAEEVIQSFRTAPILFAGSGFSRRYCKTPDWRSLLVELSKVIKTDTKYPWEYYIEKYGYDKDLDACAYLQIAEYLEEDFNKRFVQDDTFSSMVDVSADDLKQNISPFLSYLAQRFSKIKAKMHELNSEEHTELEVLKVAAQQNIDGVITTNYDGFLESVFEGFDVYSNQDDMMANLPTGYHELYKIHGCYTKPKSLVFTKKSYEVYQEKSPYLYAKLLSMFIEHPILFMGYSATDPDIMDIFNSISKCLNEKQMQSFVDNMVFVQYDATAETPSVSVRAFNAGKIPLQMKQIDTRSFLPIFEALRKVKRTYNITFLKKVREDLFHAVMTNEPKEYIRVVSPDYLDVNQDVDNIYAVIGFTRLESHSLVDPLKAHEHIVLNNVDIEIKTFEEQMLPKLLNDGPCPVFYYTKWYLDEGYRAVPQKVLDEIMKPKSLDDFIPPSEKKKRGGYIIIRLSMICEIMRESEPDTRRRLI